MEIYQLKAFVTAARLGNLTRTAEVLHVTQPAITAQIKALEEELGVALFDRRPGRISLTKAGEALLGEADRVLSAAAQLLGKARELQGEVSGLLGLGTVGDPEALRLGDLVAALVQTLPMLDIKTKSGNAEDLRELVAAGALQGSFYIGPNIPREVGGLALQTVRYRIVAPVALEERLRLAGWQQLAALPWIVAPPQHHIHTLMRDLFARQGVLPNVALESDEAAAPLSLIRSGVGLALMREDVAVPASERGELLIWPHARVAALLSFIYPKSAEHDPALVATLSVLRQVWGLPA